MLQKKYHAWIQYIYVFFFASLYLSVLLKKINNANDGLPVTSHLWAGYAELFCHREG